MVSILVADEDPVDLADSLGFKQRNGNPVDLGLALFLFTKSQLAPGIDQVDLAADGRR